MTDMRQKILVLGATGHLGANSAVHLKESGYQVIAVGHRNSDNGFFATKGISYIGGFSLEDSYSYEKLPQDIDAVQLHQMYVLSLAQVYLSPKIRPAHSLKMVVTTGYMQ